jgi:flagellar hook capping protein FlgD
MNGSACTIACICSFGFAVGVASARPAAEVHQVAPEEADVDIVGDVDHRDAAPEKVLADTVWIADWSFDTGSPCAATGWVHVDNHIQNDGTNYWHLEPTAFNGVRTITGQSAAVGYHNNTCCEDPNGYDNDWYYGIRMTYRGAATLSFDFLVDSESGFDFVQVETDSACASFGRVDLYAAPSRPTAASYRAVVFDLSGYNGPPGNTGISHVGNQALTNYGAATHCAYITFFSDAGYSPCDGVYPTTLGEGAVIDNISLMDADGTRSEDFEDGQLSNGWTFMNMQDTKPFGTWARLFPHISDNDMCTENATCAWLWTDNTTPTIANDPSMAFGPDAYVVRNWLDDIIIGPWVSLASTPAATGTILKFRMFGGNFFNTSRIVLWWSVRGKPACGSGASAWGHAFSSTQLDFFRWLNASEKSTPGGFNMTPYFDPTTTAIQLRFRTTDLQWIAGSSAPVPFIPGPGPFVDRVRIGRVVLSGPVISEGIDARSQGQDCFPTEISPIVTPAGAHYRPTTDRFGTCAFSEGTDLAVNRTGPNLVTGDSVNVSVLDTRGAGGVTSVQWYGATVGGPHQGLAPAPWAVGANGFFSFNADSCRTTGGLPIANRYFVDLDDTYFRGGDELHYLWLAQDAQGGVASDPAGITDPAQITSDAAVQARTGGLLEVSFLPTINWDPAYLTRIRAQDPGHGDVAPTAAELSGSTQRSCILYVNHINSRRLSGDINRTSFMYTLDNLGYRGYYDVYDHQGMGNTNNHLGGRATIQQAQGYNLIVYDAGNSDPGRPIMPNGIDLDAEKIDQATWFRNWLAQAALPGVSFATLWVIGSNALEEKPTNPLYTTNMGVTLAATNQGLAVSPDCAGQGSFGFDNGAGSVTVSFTTGNRATFSLNGGCPALRSYDALNASAATSARVYRYQDPRNQALGAGSVVANVNAAEDWNTLLMSFPWFDIRDRSDASPPPPFGQPLSPPATVDLLNAILGGVLPPACRRGTNPTDVPDAPRVDAPSVSSLRQNHPNPFNPVTTIRFDLAQSGRVQLRIYNAAGRKVRTLLDTAMQAGWDRSVTWNGIDDAGRRLPTGVYLYQLDAAGITMTKKMVLMK